MAAYFPHAEGLTLSEGAALLKTILADPRVRLVEVSEYATLRDLDRRRVGELTDIWWAPSGAEAFHRPAPGGESKLAGCLVWPLFSATVGPCLDRVSPVER